MIELLPNKTYCIYYKDGTEQTFMTLDNVNTAKHLIRVIPVDGEIEAEVDFMTLLAKKKWLDVVEVKKVKKS